MLLAGANCQAVDAQATDAPGRRLAVLLPLPLAGPYDYLAPADGPAPAVGDFVRVPLGRRWLTGVVWGAAAGTVAADKCRAIAEGLPVPPLPEASRRFVDWVAGYCLAPPGAVLKMTMSVPAALEPAAPSLRYQACDAPAELKMTAARRRVMEVAWAPQSAAELARLAGVGPGVVQGLVRAGGLAPVAASPSDALPVPDWRLPGLALSGEQAEAAAGLRRQFDGGFSVTLLEGVTGSGKTEVYFEAIAEALARGRQVLVLLPEIVLSAQWLERFRRRFGALPLQWHSEISDGRRRQVWRAAIENRAAVVVGARSALFLPFADLGLIVVDEEHDGSFKQEDGVHYHARDMAVVRGRLGGLPVVLASATPSLETRVNVEGGRYGRCHLPNRHGGASLPPVTLVDLRRDAPARQSWLSPPLQAAIGETLAAGRQTLLFLNRRGYAPLTLCRKCGFRLQCAQCSAWLVLHRAGPQGAGGGRLQCHHCGHVRRLPTACPECAAEDCFASCGPGVERLAEEVAARFPEARTEVMASDTVGGPAAAARLVERMTAGEIDILVGTQVVAKGHHFPLLTLVGVVDGDLGLAGGDLRAAERTFQLLSQVAGRAGRAQDPGRVLLQTWQPEDKVMQALASGDGERFYRVESEDRRDAGMPPFGRLVALVVSGPEAAVVAAVAQALARAAPVVEGVRVLGPAPAPLALLRGRHRQRLLLKAPRHLSVQPLLRRWLTLVAPPAAVRIQVDVDPYSFL